jgi:hypothetical protein
VKKVILIIIFGLIYLQLYSQNESRIPSSKRHFLEIQGIVQDSIQRPIGGANILLLEATDTLKIVSAADGSFSFYYIKPSAFIINIHAYGFYNYTHKFSGNESLDKIIIPPVILKENTTTLQEVSINGTPSVVYKHDTTEYNAKDYKVRAYATLDEALKKMEGIEIGADGSMTYQGQKVTKAKLNGKEFSGGDVAQTIKNLPADIWRTIKGIKYNNQSQQISRNYGPHYLRRGYKKQI